MSTFLGIGLGPIQTGIFLAGAAKGGFDRIVRNFAVNVEFEVF